MRIDPHVHLRDGTAQRQKETLLHGFQVAWDSGLSGVFEMPNTEPPLTGRRAVEERIAAADRVLRTLKIPLFHGLHLGLISDRAQNIEAVRLWGEYFPRIAGLKLYAGHSTGNMGVISREDQRCVYSNLAEAGFNGVLMVHCEKEGLINSDLFSPADPVTHLQARPPEAELESVRDQITLAAETGFRGTLHICHVSVPETVGIIESGRPGKPFAITCGITPHHALLSAKHIQGEHGLFLKVNPPLRTEAMRRSLFETLLAGKIDWIETDHAPHTRDEKLSNHFSGIPGLQFYAGFIRILRKAGADEKLIGDLTAGNILKTFRMDPFLFPVNPAEDYSGISDHRDDYGFDPFKAVR